MMYVPHGGVKSYDVATEANSSLMVSMVKSRLKPLSSVILGLGPRMTEERVDRPLASAKETSELFNPNKKGATVSGDPTCAAVDR